MQVTRNLKILAIVAAGALLLAGCATTATPSTTAPADASDTPVSGGTLRFGQLAAANVLDPHYASNYAEGIITSNIADKLTYQDPNTGEVQPWLAESWESNDDLTSFTFTIRDGVTFSDGTELNAESVKENFDLLGLGDESLGITAIVELFPGYVGSEVDGDTVTITFDRPSAGFLSATSHFNAAILASSTLAKTKEERGDYTNIVASGPFTIAEYEPQVKTVLEKRDDYDWAPPSLANADGAAYLDSVELYVIPEATGRTGALRAGELDAILDVQPTDEAPLEAEGFALTTTLVPGKNVTLSLRPDKSPTDDLAVRQAIQIGWDRAGLATTVLTPNYPVATSVISQNVAGYSDFGDSALAYDPEAAAELLEDAGWLLGDDGVRVKDGERLALEILTSTSLVTTKSSLEYVQQQLRDLGIEVNITILPSAEWGAERRTPEKWNGVAYNQTRNDITVIDEVYSPERSNVSFLVAGEEGVSEVAAQLTLLNTTVDPGVRSELGYEAQELVLDTYALAVPLYTNAQVIASSDRVHGVAYDANARAAFYGTWIEPSD